MAAQYMALDSFWVDKPKYDEAERIYYEHLGSVILTPLADEVARARQRLIEFRGNVEEGKAACTLPDQRSKPVEPVVKRDTVTLSGQPEKTVEPPTCSLSSVDGGALKFLEKKMTEFQSVLAKIENCMNAFDARLVSIEKRIGQATPVSAPVCQKPAAIAQEDDDVDLFGSDSEDDEASNKLKEERLAAYNAKKSKKPALIAKSNIIFDVKPWDDETDMEAMEVEVRKIKMDGLLWGASKLVPLAYGIHKLQITSVVEDEKVSVDLLQEKLEELEDFVQSIDIAAFNKI